MDSSFFHEAGRFRDESKSNGGTELYKRLKWLVFFRTLFFSLLTVSTVALQLNEQAIVWNRPLLLLYGFIAASFCLSLLYSLLLKYSRQLVWQAYIQIFIDTVSVSAIIFLTGNFSSLFAFLYLVVIIYSSILLFRKGSMVMAAICCIQYGILVDLEFYGIVTPFGIAQINAASGFAWSYVLYKVMIIMVACFAVAFLSGLLAEQARKTKKELLSMESHVRRVEKMAAVGEMAAGLAHEIKNPLASLRGSIQLLQEETQCEPGHAKLMEIVLRETDRLSALVNNFLLFAKPPAGKKNALELGTVFSETLSLLKKSTHFNRHIQIGLQIVPGVWINMDEGHLRQILWNLLLNAVESIKEEGEVNVAVFPEKKKYAVISIKDTGCGISKEKLQFIFDPFFTTKPNGTGLGLSIVHRIIESYHGRLDVESIEGEGTDVSVKFFLIDSPTEMN